MKPVKAKTALMLQVTYKKLKNACYLNVRKMFYVCRRVCCWIAKDSKTQL